MSQLMLSGFLTFALALVLFVAASWLYLYSYKVPARIAGAAAVLAVAAMFLLFYMAVWS